jgi:DNA-binding NarL/FixJ family response regulator
MTVIASRPGIMQEALRAMLALSPRIELAGTAGSGLLVVSLVRKYLPALVVIDSNLVEEEMVALLQKIKQEQPHIRCLVLAETGRQQQVMVNAGADAVLLRSEPAERIVDVLEKIQ